MALHKKLKMIIWIDFMSLVNSDFSIIFLYIAFVLKGWFFYWREVSTDKDGNKTKVFVVFLPHMCQLVSSFITLSFLSFCPHIEQLNTRPSPIIKARITFSGCVWQRGSHLSWGKFEFKKYFWIVSQFGISSKRNLPCASRATELDLTLPCIYLFFVFRLQIFHTNIA